MSSVASILSGTPAVINSALLPGGGGGAQTLSQSGNSILLSGGGGSVDVSTTTSVASSAQKTTAQTYSEGLLATSFDGDMFLKRTQVGTAVGPTTLTVFQNIDQYGDSAIHQFYTSASVPQGSIGLVSGVNLNIASSGGLTMGTANTGSGNGNIDIIEGQVRMRATEYVGVLDGTDIRLSGGVIDNSLSSGTAGQFLSCGAGGEVVWDTPGGGGGGQVLSQSGNTVSLSGGGGSVDIASTTLVADTATKTTAQSYDGGLLATSFDGDTFLKRTQVGTAVGPTTFTVFQNIDQYGDSAIHQFYTSASVPQGSIGLVSGVNLNIASSGGLTMGTANTGSGNGSIDIIEGQVRMRATEYVGVLDGTDIRLSGGIIDNSLSSGTAGQFLGCGAGGEVVWASAGGGGVQSVVAGSNIAVDNTDPANPIVAVAVSSAIEMNSYNITSTGALAVQSDVSVSLDAPFVYLPQIPSAVTTETLYYDSATKAVSYGLATAGPEGPEGPEGPAGPIGPNSAPAAPSVYVNSAVVGPGTGTYADPFLSINDGITAVTAGGTLFLTGTFDYSVIPVPPAQQVALSITKAGIKIANYGSANIRWTGLTPLANSVMWSIIGAGIVLEGLTFSLPTMLTSGGMNLLRMDGVSQRVRSCVFQGPSTYDAFTPGALTTRALEISTNQNLGAVENCRMSNFRQPAFVNGGSTALLGNIAFNDNVVSNTRGFVLAGPNQFSTWSNNSWGQPNVLDIVFLSSVANGAPYADLVTLSQINNGALIQDQRVATAGNYQYSGLIGAVSVVASLPATVTPSLQNKGTVYVYSGASGTLTFSNASLSSNNAGFFVVVKNGSSTDDITIATTPGALSGNTVVHRGTGSDNGGVLYLYWTGTAWVGY